MAYDGALRASASDALKMVRDRDVVGLGSGRAAAVLVESLARLASVKNYEVTGVPTSLQIKMVAERHGIATVGADQVGHIDVMFDGADQVDSRNYVIKGGGGALLRESIMFSLARKVVVLADETKFARNLTKAVPVEVHPQARRLAADAVGGMGGRPSLRLLDRGYPFFTENGNVILDCDFGTVRDPGALTRRIMAVSGVMESGIFLRRPDIAYKARAGGKFDVVRRPAGR